jgi:hypothetical protein
VGTNGKTKPMAAKMSEIVPAIMSRARRTLFFLGFTAGSGQVFGIDNLFLIMYVEFCFKNSMIE